MNIKYFQIPQRFGRVLTIAALLVAAGLNSSLSAAVMLSYDFGRVGDANVKFAGGSFTYEDSTAASAGYDIQFGAGALSGMVGNISGTYTIGTILTPFAGFETAAVTGSGTFSIFDGTNTLSGTISMVSIYTSGTGGTINSGGTYNLTGISYSGSNADLIQLASIFPDNTASVTISFTFIPAKTLTELKAATIGSPLSTSFSGTIAAERDDNIPLVPEPMSLAIWSLGALGAAVAGVRRKKLVNG